jgi:hypothetical protein
MFTQEALSLLIFLLPGFLSMAIIDMLTPGRKRDNLQRIINALIFSLLIYAIYFLIFDNYPITPIKKNIQPDKDILINLPRLNLGILIVISLAIPLIMGYLIRKDLHMKFLRWLKVTDRTSRSNVWFDVFTDKKSYVIVNFQDGRRLFGWPEYFSDDPRDQTIFLCHASWIKEDGQTVVLDNKGILVTPNEPIDTIEFVYVEGEER